MRTTINHARSFEDCLRRIESIERVVNDRVGEDLLCFQSTHPNCGGQLGGRTSMGTIETTITISAVLLASCLWFGIDAVDSVLMSVGYSLFTTLVSASLLVTAVELRWRQHKP